MSEFFLKVVNMSISASYLVFAVLLLRLALKKAPKWVSVLLWGFVAIRLICPLSVESMLSLIPSAETISPEIMMDWTPEISTGIGSLDTVVNPIITESFAPDPGASMNPLQLWIPLAALIWILGIAVMLSYTAISYTRLRLKVATAVLLRDNIYQSENVDSPFVLGIIKPRIYLPFRMDSQNLGHVIAHEESHIRRKDHWWKPFGFLLLAIHWFNPILWIGYAFLCRDIELACDERVVKGMDNASKADYSQALVDCSVNRRSIAACPLAFGEVGVKARVRSVMNHKKPAFWVVVAAIVACVAVAVCFLTDPKKEDAPSLAENGYFLLIGADDVESIEISGPNTSGGAVNANGSAFQKGEKVWLEALQGVTDLRGYSIIALGKNGKVVYALSIPAGATDSEVINLVSTDGWLLAPADFENYLSAVRGKTYVYENGGFMGNFFITLYDDGTFAYYEGNASSYYGIGIWKQTGDSITLNDDLRIGPGLTNRFKLDGDALVFIEENSTNFIYVKVKSGEKFYCTGEVVKTENGADKPAQLGGDKTLSLSDVITLSEKGYDLGWGDFAAFKYYETGSGLYIRVYEIDETYQLWIGGTEEPEQDRAPMYIYLTLAADPDQKMDIRDGGVAEFISKYNDIIGIDRAIEEAILEYNGGDRFVERTGGTIKAESHCILGMTPKSGTPIIGQTNHRVETTVYIQYVYNRYMHSDDKLVPIAGISTPAMLTFSYDPESGYELKEFWEPNGGSTYEAEIRSKFPKDIADMVLDPQNDVIDVGALEAKCMAKAQKADIDALLSKCQDNVQGYVSDLFP